jgi:hypothetical protein
MNAGYLSFQEPSMGTRWYQHQQHGEHQHVAKHLDTPLGHQNIPLPYQLFDKSHDPFQQ